MVKAMLAYLSFMCMVKVEYMTMKRSSSTTVTKKASVNLTNNKAPKSDENAEGFL